MTDTATHSAPAHERATPRALTRHGLWSLGPVRVKVYGIAAGEQILPDDLLSKARAIAAGHLARVGPEVGLGFVIVHPGSEGTSVLTLWWERSSVLCQRVTRWPHGAGAEVDMRSRGVVGCVWELAVIAAEQEIWRRHMMGRAPSPDGYLGETFTARQV